MRAKASMVARAWLLPAVLGMQSLAAAPDPGPTARPPAAPRKIVLIAGDLDGHPAGTHEYEKSVRLLKHCLDTAPSLPAGLRTELHFHGWPEDAATLDDADTIVMISAGSDRNEADHPFYVSDRMDVLDRQMARGCGLVAIHWSTFAPLRAKARILRWLGGFFDYQGGADGGWFSTIATRDWTVHPATPAHPVLAGVAEPFALREEFYHRLRFLPGDDRLVPLWRIDDGAGSEAAGTDLGGVTAWCVQRDDGGRGFGCTGGHFYANWEVPGFRKTILNAIVWTAGLPVPKGGVESALLDVDETRGIAAPPSHRALILTGHHHPGHDWQRVTEVLRAVLHEDGRLAVDVTLDPEILARADLSEYDVLVQNYNNWDRPGWSEGTREAFRRFVADGGGLVILHYANGAFYRTTPAGIRSHWDEYAGKICRRFWDHAVSGHDPFGPFTARITDAGHPITAGLAGATFETIDELYFTQQGDLPITPLVTARSKVTDRDEPLAFAYAYGNGRVFQSLLGHAPESVAAAGTAELLRRGTLWAAGAALQPGDPAHLAAPASTSTSAATVPAPAAGARRVEGPFGRALDARIGGVSTPGSDAFRTPPLTIECRARLFGRSGFNILAASEPKASPTHWELYTYAGSGELSLYLPGRGGEFRSGVPICDGRWHHVAAHVGTDAVRLFVDGRQVLERAADPPPDAPFAGGFAIGRLVEGTIGCDGLVDDVRLSRGLRAIKLIPASPLEADAETLRLWSFEGEEDDETEANGPPGAANTADPAGVTPAIGTFTPRLGLDPELSGRLASHPFNAERLDRFYAQEAEHFMAMPRDALPDILPPFPGMDGGAFGHWGRRNDADWRDDAWNAMDLGPVFAGVLHGLGQPVPKAVCARLGEMGSVAVAFDPLTGGIVGAWTGGFVRFDESRFGLLGGIAVDGQVLFDAGATAGWGPPVPGEPIAPEFLGTHRAGRRAVFSYRLGEIGVLDAPWEIPLPDEGPPAITRTIEFDSPAAFALRLFPGAELSFAEGDRESGVVVSGVPGAFGHAAVRWTTDGSAAAGLDADGTFLLRLANVRRLGLACSFHGDREAAARATGRPIADEIAASPSRWTKGGEPLWPERLVTRGELGSGDGAYVIDTLTVPHENPWNALFFLSGHDFFADGSAAVCTINGDVWTVSGIDAGLDRLEWRRFASGLHQPLGLVVVDDRVHVLGRDQITVLHDLDGNGEADFHENLTHDFATSPGGHDFVTGLERDQAGNLYFASANQGVCRVRPDGSDLEVVATGLRNPNGLGVSPDGLIAVSPQEGDWTPASMVCLAKPGRHFGYRGPRDGRIDPPACYIPRGVDHSTGGHVFADSDRWGPLGGHLITFSWGNCRTLLTLLEDVDGIEQGAVVPLPGDFLSGVHRGRIHPLDGQLYVTGSNGWVTYATSNGCFQRLRHTGRPARIPVAFHAHRNGIRLRFSEPVDGESAADPGRWFVQRWNYEFSRGYGSPEFSAAFPETPGHDPVAVSRAAVIDGGLGVFLEVPGMAPVDQLHVHGRLRSADGAAFDADLFATVHRLAPAFEEYGGFRTGSAPDAPAPDLRRAARAGDAPTSAAVAAATPSALLPKHRTAPLDDGPGTPVRIRCLSGLRFDTTEFTVEAGKPVELTLENTDVIPHNLVIVAPGSRAAVGERAARMLTEPRAVERQYVPDMDEVLVHTLVLDPGQSDTLRFRAPADPGEYPFLCTFPGHWLVMHGVMVVR